MPIFNVSIWGKLVLFRRNKNHNEKESILGNKFNEVDKSILREKLNQKLLK
jgi:hypothetical protein